MIATLDDFSFGGLGLAEGDFVAPDQVIQVGYPPLHIDLLTGIDGVNFDTAWSARLVCGYDGLMINFIGIDALVANKRGAG